MVTKDKVIKIVLDGNWDFIQECKEDFFRGSDRYFNFLLVQIISGVWIFFKHVFYFILLFSELSS